MRRYAVGAVTVIDAGRRPVDVVFEDDLPLKETDPYGTPAWNQAPTTPSMPSAVSTAAVARLRRSV